METAHLGIDGGGSGGRGRRVLPDGAAFEAQGGPAYAFSDLSGAATALGELAKELTKAANWSGPLHCVAGVAGCRLPAQGQALADALPLAAKVVDDAVIAARGALGAGRSGHRCLFLPSKRGRIHPSQRLGPQSRR